MQNDSTSAAAGAGPAAEDAASGASAPTGDLADGAAAAPEGAGQKDTAEGDKEKDCKAESTGKDDPKDSSNADSKDVGESGADAASAGKSSEATGTATGAEGSGKRRRKRKKKRKKKGGAAAAAAAVPKDFKPKKAHCRLLGGCTNYYVKYGQTEPPTIPVAKLFSTKVCIAPKSIFESSLTCLDLRCFICCPGSHFLKESCRSTWIRTVTVPRARKRGRWSA